jgi:hypothetical protein
MEFSGQLMLLSAKWYPYFLNRKHNGFQNVEEERISFTLPGTEARIIYLSPYND